MSNIYIAKKQINKIEGTNELIEKQSYIIDKIFFAFIFIIAFMPRPTVDSSVALIAPIVISIFLFLSLSYFFLNGVGIISSNYRLINLFTIMFFIIFLYATRIAIRNESNELNYLLGRILSFLIIVVFLTWLNSRQVSVVEIYKSIFFSVIFVSLIVTYFGITGRGGFFIFSGMEHGREFSSGFSVPFYRSAGIERSYGEFGIFLSAAWAYYLLFRKNHTFIIRSICGILLILSIIISQSRTTWLALILVTTTFLFIKVGGRKIIIYFLLAMTFFLPLVTNLISTVGRELPGIRSIIGDRNIHEANVESRHNIDVLAINLFFKKPVEMLVGISHAKWFEAFPRNFEKDSGHGIAGIHNHFLANLVYMGLFSGLLYMLLYLIPAIRLINLDFYHQKDIFLILLCTIGLITCLNFFEGFFSPISSVILATLIYTSYRSEPEKVNKKVHSENSHYFSSKSPRQRAIRS
jgi:O-antigen ligase